MGKVDWASNLTGAKPTNESASNNSPKVNVQNVQKDASVNINTKIIKHSVDKE